MQLLVLTGEVKFPSLCGQAGFSDSVLVIQKMGFLCRLCFRLIGRLVGLGKLGLVWFWQE